MNNEPRNHVAEPAECPSRVCDSAELLLRLVNTSASDNGRNESLAGPEDFERWLSDVGLRPPGERVTGADTVSARELRQAFATVFRTHCGCAEAPVHDAETYLGGFARRYPLVPRITAEGVSLAPAQTGVPGVFGALLAAAADLSTRGAWSRMKICMNPTCWAAFFDKTRNQSGQYCSAACGSQVAMRAYRSRLRGDERKADA